MKAKPKNILVKMPNWLGDAIMATPILEDLKKHWPEARLTILCQSNVAALFNYDPYVDEIFSYTKPSGWIHRTWHKNVIDHLQHGDYDLGVLLTNSFSSAWWLWRGHVGNTIGYTSFFRRFLLDQSIPFPEKIEKQHLVVTYKMLLQQLGIPVSNTKPKLYLSQSEKQVAQDFLSRHDVSKDSVVVGINPGAAYGSAKCWLPDRFKEVALKLLQKPNVFVLFFGDQTGAPLVNSICQDMPERVINMAGKTTLRELMALIQACSIFLTNDSGPMHMASALNVPLLALFGSTSEIKTGPYNGGKVIHKHVECSPCFLRECPKVDFPCMTRIGAQEVYDELKTLIEEQNKG